MNLQEELRINDSQPGNMFMNHEVHAILSAIAERDADLSVKWLMAEAYTYGVIQGKRAERARRRKENV